MDPNLCPACVCSQPWLPGSGNLGPILASSCVHDPSEGKTARVAYSWSWPTRKTLFLSEYMNGRMCLYREIDNVCLIYPTYIPIWPFVPQPACSICILPARTELCTTLWRRLHSWYL
jgi:hypothetical protein